MRAADWIARLGLEPHPEGGHYRETYRAAATTPTPRGERAASTAIHYLLEHGEVSRLHRLRSDELFHHYAGDPLTIHVLDDDGTYESIELGGERPQAVVLAGRWFGAEVETSGGFALVGCTVAPGFDFADFELAQREPLLARFPERRALIERFVPRR